VDGLGVDAGWQSPRQNRSVVDLLIALTFFFSHHQAAFVANLAEECNNDNKNSNQNNPS